jgi:hypothetical protein
MKQSTIGLILLTLIIFFVLPSASSGVEALFDPGLPDSVVFEGIDYYVDGPPYTGKLKISVTFFNDEDVNAISIPFVWSGPVLADSGSFVGSRVEHANGKLALIDSVNCRIVLATLFYYETIPPGRGLFATMYFSLLDTGYVEIDTAFHPPSSILQFADPAGGCWQPQFTKLQLHVVRSIAGDANQDESVGLPDIVFIINYLFRSGPTPACSNCTDVDCDCEISLVDVVYLINYLFRSGDPPQVGCVLPL